MRDSGGSDLPGEGLAQFAACFLLPTWGWSSSGGIGVSPGLLGWFTVGFALPSALPMPPIPPSSHPGVSEAIPEGSRQQKGVRMGWDWHFAGLVGLGLVGWFAPNGFALVAAGALP